MKNHPTLSQKKHGTRKPYSPKSTSCRAMILAKVKAEVHQDSGKYGIKFTLDKTIPELDGSQKNNLNWAHSFVEFENVLQGQYKTAWKQVLHKIFPEPDDPAMVPAEHDHSLTENFHRAIELFIKTAIHKEKPWD
jgi:hypothetical protein